MIDWLYGLQHFGVKLGLDNIRALLEVLEHPEQRYPCVLIAGTNGKGSVAAMLHEMLRASGRTPGLFTSPHLVRPNERIRIGGEDISTDELNAALGRMRQRIEHGLDDGRLEVHPSFFEVITATALQCFADRGVDVGLLEVGLGGRLDATNAVEADLSVIVSIDLDHTKSLGATVERIAGEKAGIIKAGKPLISGVSRQRAITVLQDICAVRGAGWVDARVEVDLESDGPRGFTLRTKWATYDDLRVGLPGRHQIDNARVAVAALETIAPRLGFKPDAEAVRRGLSKVRWPGRLQWVEGMEGLPDLLFDGAHNPAGCGALARYLKTLDRPAPVALFGIMHGKLLPEMLEPLAPWLHGLVVTRPEVRRAEDPEVVAAIAAEYCERVDVVPEPAAALKRACEIAGDERYVLVTGSLYLAGTILALLDGRPAPGPVAM